MNSGLFWGIFDQGTSHIAWTIRRSNSLFQTTVKNHGRICCMHILMDVDQSLTSSSSSNYVVCTLGTFSLYLSDPQPPLRGPRRAAPDRARPRPGTQSFTVMGSASINGGDIHSGFNIRKCLISPYKKFSPLHKIYVFMVYYYVSFTVFHFGLEFEPEFPLKLIWMGQVTDKLEIR